jgi:ATP-dependent DNA ligase
MPYAWVCNKFRVLQAVANHHPRYKPAVLRVLQKRVLFTTRINEARLRGESLYPVLRLLLPVSDADRNKYGLQEAKLVQLLHGALGVRPDSADGARIRDWKKTASADGRGSRDAVQADLPGVLRDVLSSPARAHAALAVVRLPKNAGLPVSEVVGEWTVRDVNDWLDEVRKVFVGGGRDNVRGEEAVKLAGGGGGGGSGSGGGGGGRRPWRAAGAYFVPHTSYEPLFRILFNSCGVDEIVWTLRHLLRDLRLGLSPDKVMNWFHPDAVEALNMSAGLRSILEDPDFKLPTSRKKVSIQLMTAFLPCTCERYWLQAPSSEITSCGDFFIEQKIDGERMLVHVKRAAVGADFQAFLVFSRNRVTYKKYLAVLRAPLRECMADDVLEAIFDGEVCAWDHDNNMPMAFGAQRDVAQAQMDKTDAEKEEEGWMGSGGGGGGGERPHGRRNAGDDDDSGASAAEEEGNNEDEGGAASINFIVFDCCWLRLAEGGGGGGGGSGGDAALPQGNLTDRPLAMRKLALERALPREKPGYITRLPSQRVRASGKFANEAIERALLAAWGQHEEGIVVKAASSPYLCGKSKYWVKVKPEYATQNNSLDLAVVGGFLPEGRTWRNQAVHKYGLKYPNCLEFLLAMPRWAPGEKERCAQSGSTARDWVPLCKVGSGYKESDVPWLNERLGPHWKAPAAASGSGRQPAWLLGALTGKNIPDFFIEPCDSIVVELKGSELQEASGGFCARVRARSGGTLDVTVRFPRLAKVRTDKGVNDAETEVQLQEIWNAGGSLSKLNPAEAIGSQKRRREADAKAGAAGGSGGRARGGRRGGGGGGGGGSGRASKAPAVHPGFILSKQPAEARVLSGMFVVLPAPADAYAAAAAHHRLDERLFGNRQALVDTIQRLGGRVVLNAPSDGTGVTCVGLGGRAEGQPQDAAHGLAYAGGRDVLSPAWVADAWLAKAKPTTLRVAHVAWAGAATRAALAREVDDWGDEHAGPDFSPAAAKAYLLRVAAAPGGAPAPLLAREDLAALATPPLSLFRDAALAWPGAPLPALLGGLPGKPPGCLAFFPALASAEAAAAADAMAAAAGGGGGGGGMPPPPPQTPSDPASVGDPAPAAPRPASALPWFAPHFELARRRQDVAREAARTFRALGGRVAAALGPGVDVVLVDDGGAAGGAEEVAALREEAERRRAAGAQPLPPVGPLQWVTECALKKELVPLKRLL